MMPPTLSTAVHGSFLAGCLGNTWYLESSGQGSSQAMCRDFLKSYFVPRPLLKGIWGGGGGGGNRERINISYCGDCAGGIFLILSVHILRYWLQNWCLVPPSDSLVQGLLKSTGVFLFSSAVFGSSITIKAFGSKQTLCRKSDRYKEHLLCWVIWVCAML